MARWSGRKCKLFNEENSTSYLMPDGSVTFEDIKLNVLSSTTHPPNRQLRFSVEPLEPYMDRKDLTSSSTPFLSVAKTISGKKAEKEREHPSGPTGNQIELDAKRNASQMAAQAVHDKRFRDVPAALKAKEFDLASEKLAYKALKAMQNPSSEEASSEEASGEESSGEESSGDAFSGEALFDEAAASEEEYEWPDEEEPSADVGAEVASAIVVSAELKAMKEECLQELNNWHCRPLHRRRVEHVESLFTEAVVVAEGLEGKPVSLVEAERARLAFSCRPFTPVDAALEEALFTFFDATCATLGVPPERCAVQKAVASFKERIYAESSKRFWEQRVPELAAEEHRIIKSGALRRYGMPESLKEATRDHMQAKKKLREIMTPLPGIGGIFTKVAKGIDDVLLLVQEPPSGCDAQLNVLRQIRDVFSTNEAIATAALASAPASTATMQSWRSLLRRAGLLCVDMEKDVHSLFTFRCDASFLGTLDSDSVHALAQAADHLRRLASDCKSGSAMQLASTPVPADAPPAGTQGAAVKSTPQRMDLRVLPPIEAIDGSSASVLSVPSALLSMPPACILQFIAENVLLPPKPCGSKLLAERALPDVLRLLDAFDKRMSAGVESADGRGITCLFKASGELSDASLNHIRKTGREAARLLRGGQPPKQGVPAAPDTSSVDGIELDEDKTGVLEDEESGELRSQFSFQITIYGEVYEYTHESADLALDLGRHPAEEDHYDWIESNRERARIMACEEKQRLRQQADQQAKRAAAEEKRHRWESVKNGLHRYLQDCERDGKELGALVRVAGCLHNVEIDTSIDPSGRMRGGGRRHRATTHCDDGRCSIKNQSVNVAVGAPVHIGREDLERGGGPPTDSRIASNVLNSIASKADLSVVHAQHSVAKGQESKAKGKRTTEHKYFLPIRSVDDLLKVADVVSEGIEIFRNSTGTEAKKAWLSNDKKAGSVGKKRKRAQ